MRALVAFLASPRLAFFGMALLGVGAALSYDNPERMSIWVLVVPLGLMAVNLLVAICTNARIYRRKALLLFHVGLLGMVVLAAIGRLTLFEAHLEMLEGNAFSNADLINVKQGIWHSNGLSDVNFVQGRYTVEYRPGMVRGLTHSYVLVRDDNRVEERIIGDDRPLVVDGYRFYTTFNKGFAPVLTWTPDGGEPVSGAVHMPSYPLFEHKQANEWAPPGMDVPIKFWLRLDTGLDADAYWILNERPAKSTLVVNVNERRVELAPGETVRLANGTLRYERLLTWMGYKIFYDPTLHAMFVASIISVVGLFLHFWQKFGQRLALPATTPKPAHARKTPVSRGLAR